MGSLDEHLSALSHYLRPRRNRNRPNSAKKTVLLTGFGPFRDVVCNPSWEAVKPLQGVELSGCTVETALLPVEYEGQHERVATLWRQHSPVLCVHVGVGRKGAFALETECRVGPYRQKDALGKHCGSSGECIVDSTPCLRTRCPVESVLAVLQAEEGALAVRASSDAGLYLCEFTYYISSARREAPVIFVHVPPVGHPYTQAQINATLERIIRTLLTELNNDGQQCN